jgi:hypothetical protein
LGLLRERVRLAGGTLEVMAAPGRGTHLVMSMPLPAGPGPRETWPSATAALRDDTAAGADVPVHVAIVP